MTAITTATAIQNLNQRYDYKKYVSDELLTGIKVQDEHPRFDIFPVAVAGNSQTTRLRPDGLKDTVSLSWTNRAIDRVAQIIDAKKPLYAYSGHDDINGHDNRPVSGRVVRCFSDIHGGKRAAIGVVYRPPHTQFHATALSFEGEVMFDENKRTQAGELLVDADQVTDVTGVALLSGQEPAFPAAVRTDTLQFQRGDNTMTNNLPGYVPGQQPVNGFNQPFTVPTNWGQGVPAPAPVPGQPPAQPMGPAIGTQIYPAFAAATSPVPGPGGNGWHIPQVDLNSMINAAVSEQFKAAMGKLNPDGNVPTTESMADRLKALETENLRLTFPNAVTKHLESVGGNLTDQQRKFIEYAQGQYQPKPGEPIEKQAKDFVDTTFTTYSQLAPIFTGVDGGDNQGAPVGGNVPTGNNNNVPGSVGAPAAMGGDQGGGDNPPAADLSGFQAAGE